MTTNSGKLNKAGALEAQPIKNWIDSDLQPQNKLQNTGYQVSYNI